MSDVGLGVGDPSVGSTIGAREHSQSDDAVDEIFATYGSAGLNSPDMDQGTANAGRDLGD